MTGRVKRVDRMFAIVIDLQARPIVRAEDLAARYETSVRTIYRDVMALCEAGIPIVSLPGQGYALAPGFFLPPLSFALDEVAGLLLGADFVAQTLDPAYRSAARAASRKLEAIVPPALRAALAEARRGTLLVGSPAADEQLDLLRVFRDAIVEQRIVRIRYRGQRTDDATGRGDIARRVAPYALANMRGRWYVVGHSYERAAQRRFRLSRILDAHVTDEHFELPADFRVAAPDREEDAPVLIRIAFAAADLVSVTERLSGFDATLQIEGERGSAAFRTHSEAGIVPYLLSWGGSVSVLEPASLRERVVAAARRIIENAPDTQLSGARVYTELVTHRTAARDAVTPTGGASMATFALTMLASNDLARSRDFYRDVLGLTIGTDAAPHWVDFKLGGGALLGIHPADGDHLTVNPGSLSNGFTVDDVDAFIADVKTRGVPIVQEPADESFGRLAIVLDPDGYTVQIYTPAAPAQHHTNTAPAELTNA